MNFDGRLTLSEENRKDGKFGLLMAKNLMNTNISEIMQMISGCYRKAIMKFCMIGK